jgi:signal transduction histidine kinase/GAF domain-containing protein
VNTFDNGDDLAEQQRARAAAHEEMVQELLVDVRRYEKERAAHAQAELARERFAFLAEAGSVLTASLDYDETLGQLAQLVVPRLADWCFVDVLEEDGTLQHLVEAHHSPERVQLLADLRRRYPPEAITFDPVPTVLRTGQPVLVTEITDELLAVLNGGGAEEVLSVARQLGFRSGICVPLVARERIVGALSLIITESDRRYDLDDLALAEDVARRAGLAIDHARLYRQAQRALHRVEEVAEEQRAQATELTAIIEAMPGAVCVCDVHGTITRINRAAAALFGLSPDAIAPPIALADVVTNAFRPDGTPLPPEDHPLNQALRGITSTDYRFMMKRYDTYEEIHLLSTFAPFRDAGGSIIGAVAAANDITQTHALERLKDEFLGIASHELKTPLTSLKILVQLTHRRLQREHSPEAERVRGMERSLERMERLVNDMLDVTRITAGKLTLRTERYDLCLLCRKIAEEQSTISKRQISLDLPRAPLWAKVDPERIGQVLINLLSNALKYTPTGCPITVCLRATDDGQGRICVRDEGVGIPPEAQESLFQRFYRVPGVQVLNGSTVGIGLGLYISREIIDRHGGRIWVESAIGAGTSVCFTVALAAE